MRREDPIPLDSRCQILGWHHKYDILAIEKAPGVQTHKAAKGKACGRFLLQSEYLEKEERYIWKCHTGKWQSLYLVHRLDSPTSGVLLATTCEHWARSLRDSFKSRSIKKVYHAIVRTSVHSLPKIWKDQLLKRNKNNTVRVWKSNQGKSAITHFRELKHIKSGAGSLSLIKLEPLTGRTHQLRVQCALRGCPIVGDKTYGDFALNRKLLKINGMDRLFLHATKINFELKGPNGENADWEIESPIPRAFLKIFA